MKDIPAQDMTGKHTQAMETIMGNRQDLVTMGGMYTAKMQFGKAAMTRTTEYKGITVTLFNATRVFKGPLLTYGVKNP